MKEFLWFYCRLGSHKDAWNFRAGPLRSRLRRDELFDLKNMTHLAIIAIFAPFPPHAFYHLHLSAGRRFPRLFSGPHPTSNLGQIGQSKTLLTTLCQWTHILLDLKMPINSSENLLLLIFCLYFSQILKFNEFFIFARHCKIPCRNCHWRLSWKRLKSTKSSQAQKTWIACVLHHQ